MTSVLLVIHLMLAFAMIVAVLLQRSEGGGLGIGGGGGMGSFMSGRSTANLLTRTTAILAAGFMLTSLSLTILAARDRTPRSILDEIPVTSTPTPDAAPGTTPAPGEEQPARPTVPVQ